MSRLMDINPRLSRSVASNPAANRRAIAIPGLAVARRFFDHAATIAVDGFQYLRHIALNIA
jgi:hypothetical protein